jgi:CheY-like chemotaxis protein
MQDYKNEFEVLLVEDNPNDAELTLRALRTSVGGERLTHVDDGAKALELIFGERGMVGRAGARPPRMILLDLKLPKVDGLEVLRRVKADERTRGIPVVVLTSSKEERDINESYRLGVNSYLVKPVGFDEYVAAVREAGRYWLVLNQPAPGKGSGL